MPRFGLHEFSRPDYRGSLPERDPNNAIWPRISMFAKMLHDMSWEEEPEEPTEEELRDEQSVAESDMLGYKPLSSVESQMEGYHPYNETVDEPELTRSPRNMDEQRELAENATTDDPTIRGRNMSQLRKELKEVDKNSKKRIPAEDGNGYYQMGPDYIKHYQEIIGTPADGIWGKGSRAAFKKFMANQDWTDADTYDANER